MGRGGRVAVGTKGTPGKGARGVGRLSPGVIVGDDGFESGSSAIENKFYFMVRLILP